MRVVRRSERRRTPFNKRLAAHHPVAHRRHVRERHRTDTGDRASLVAKPRQKTRGPRRVIALQREVECRTEHPIAGVEVHIHVARLVHRSEEHPRHRQENQAEGQLRDHEPALQAPAAAIESNRRVLEHQRQIGARRMECRNHAEADPGQQRGNDREGQDSGVGRDVDRGRDDRRHDGRRPRRQEKAGRCGRRRENDGLGQQLSDDSRPRRAERQAHADLAPPSRGASEQKIAHVGTRDQQDEKGDRGGE